MSTAKTIDRRQQIIEVGLAILQEEGLRGFTQPRIAARAGLRQSNLTYYFPTISDLLAAVASAGVEAQLKAASGVVSKVTTCAQASEGIANMTSRHEVTRVLMSLAQAADQEAEVRMLFNALTDGLAAEIRQLFDKLGITAQESGIDLVHAVVVGLSVIELATGRRNGKDRTRQAMDLILRMLTSGPIPPLTKPEGQKPRTRKSS
ncbi:TetR/AcrR family transcriptional regulator [Paraburkholderia pallida]|uniref:TetR/AcrR family transcriptional regulator n=1 Tax=Paraburkholderia pallida TaxID=2547399 RepID=UPI001431E587|nr:TetR family transcriptional regulator [Paraburkholderia pallida]